VYWDQNDCGQTIRSAIAYSQNSWHHVAVTVEDIGSQLQIYFYLDGVQDGPYYSNVSSINNGGASSSLYIGRQGENCACNFFSGILDEVRIWNRVRSPVEINEFKNVTLTGSENGLAALYTFDQGIPAGDNGGLITVFDGTPNINNGTLAGTSLSGNISNWVDHSTLLVLPMQLSGFTASLLRGDVELRWQTVSEKNGLAFEIQRSPDGGNFNTIGQVWAAGNSSSVRNYNFRDNTPLPDVNFYRLKMIDLDGRIEFSKVAMIRLSGSSKEIEIYPNPVVQQVQVKTSISGPFNLAIYSSGGTLVKSQSFLGIGTSTVVPVNVSALVSGTYLIRVTGKEKSSSIVFVKP
jgi:hypothetical protein